MTLWEIIIEVGSGTPVLERFFYIVSCNSKERAEKLALEKHKEFRPLTKNPLVAEDSTMRLDLMDVKSAVWYNRKEIFSKGV